MPAQLFESLETRTLLSQVTLLTGAPADAEHERQALIELAELDDAGGSDEEMYRFLADREDAVYESADDESESYGILAADIGAFDADVWGGGGAYEGNAAEEAHEHPWIGRSEGPGDVDKSELAIAVQAAHKATAILPPKTGGEDRPGETKRTTAAITPIQIRFDFSTGH